MDIRLKSKEQEDLVVENQGLVHFLVLKLGITQNSSEYEDLVSIGNIGLIKAVATFDESKKIKFATYASTCINNEIFLHFRKEKSHANDVSLNSPIRNNDENDEIELGDIIESSDEDFIEVIAKNEVFEKFISIILNFLTSRERLIMLYQIAGFEQTAIAKAVKCSQSYISRLEKNLNQKVKSCYTDNKQFTEVFKMEMSKNSYKISFSSQKVKEFNKIFATLLQNLTLATTLPDFKVSCNQERIIVQVAAHPQSFSFIAQIIQQIDDWSMAFTSDKNVSVTDNSTSQKKESNVDSKIHPLAQVTKFAESDQKPNTASSAANEAETAEFAKESDTIQTSTIVSKALNSNGKKKTKGEQIIDYILTLSTFTIQDLKEKFPDFSVPTISNTLSLAQSEGRINRIGRGKYSVISSENT